MPMDRNDPDENNEGLRQTNIDACSMMWQFLATLARRLFIWHGDAMKSEIQDDSYRDRKTPIVPAAYVSAPSGGRDRKTPIVPVPPP